MQSFNNTSPRRLKLLALGVWLAMAASVGTAAWLWRSYDLRPHGALAAANLAAVLGTAAWLTLTALRVATRGRAPCAALGWWLVGTTPLLWFVVYAASVYIDVDYRQPLTLDAPLRMTGAWATSFFDLEARARYRQTPGTQTILLDSGHIASPETLVTQMDEHIASMTKLLGQPPLSAPVLWVRGSIFGMTGRSTGFWAIAGPDGSGDVLDSLDRHEAAHAVICMLAGPDHDPPAVISEGWAESQSADRDNQIRQLVHDRQSGNYYHLRELIGPDWYLRGDGPVYTHGGPLVHYLIGRFGAPKFFELYCEVRRASFDDDCQRLLGVSWDEVDADFWRWVAAENDRLPASETKAVEPAKNWKLELADGVVPADWQRLLEELKKSRSNHKLPKQIAFAARWDWKRIDNERRTDPMVSRNELAAVFDGENFWIRDRSDSESFLLSSNGRTASLTSSRSGGVEGWVGDAASRRRAQNEATQLLQAYLDAANFWPERWLPIGDKYASPATYRIERIDRPEDGQTGVWNVAVSIEHDDDGAKYCELEIDPAVDWQVTRCQIVGLPKSYTEETAEYRQIDGVWLATAGKFAADYTQHTNERVSAETSLRILTDREVNDLKQRVERIALAGPTKPWHRLRNVLQALVVAWPVLGLICIALPLLRKNQLAGGTSAKSAAIAVATTAPTSGPTTGIQA